MYTAAVSVIVASSVILAIVAWTTLKKFQIATAKHDLETAQREKELKRHLLELQVLRSLSERVGYSLDLRQILDIITDSLNGLINYSAVSYLMEGKEGRMVLRIHTAEPISHKYLNSSKNQIFASFTEKAGKSIEPSLVDETVSGSTLDDSLNSDVGSSFNLPLVVGGKLLALINISSTQKDVYSEAETAILHTILDQVSSSASKLTQVVENEKRRLSAMISSLLDGVLMVDPSYNVIVANPALKRLLGASGITNLFDVVAAVGTKANLQQVIQQSLTSQNLIKLPEFELLNTAIQIDVEPVKDKFGYLLGAAVVFHDVTSQKQLEQLREEFTAMMVHELRTPLTTISYSIDSMSTDLNKMTPDMIGKNLEIIKTTNSNMLELVNELLDVAKIEAGKFQIVKKEDDLKALIEEKINSFKPVADQKQLQLLAEIDPNLGLVSFDRRRIGQVLNNMLSNALKYTDQGRVTVKVKKDEALHQAIVSISDTGEGIKPDDLPKLFSKFEQLGKGKTGEKVGTGLGLVIAKGIIEAHNGQISASSLGEGQGTTFTFSLPLT